MTWKNGRQLATLTNGQTSASYDYDESGIRTKKTVNGITTTYQLDGSKIVSENRNGTVQSYFYDENGSVLGITYGGENYYFRKNFRGDVLAILTASGEVVVEYSYDPWGNILAVTGSLASTLGADNPFRYRGYYYDTESCFYYLNSRYYDAKVCRFVNADEPEIIDGANEHILENNLYAYCFNNPVNLTDDSGYWPSWAKKLVAAVAITACVVAVVAATVVTCGAAAPALAAVGFGVVSSISASTVATAANIAVAATIVSTAATYTYSQMESGSLYYDKNDSDPYARPGQKKQGRERKNKARKKDNWKPRSKPKVPKKHTPGRDHRKW